MNAEDRSLLAVEATGSSTPVPTQTGQTPGATPEWTPEPNPTLTPDPSAAPSPACKAHLLQHLSITQTARNAKWTQLEEAVSLLLQKQGEWRAVAAANMAALANDESRIGLEEHYISLGMTAYSAAGCGQYSPPAPPAAMRSSSRSAQYARAVAVKKSKKKKNPKRSKKSANPKNQFSPAANSAPSDTPLPGNTPVSPATDCEARKSVIDGHYANIDILKADEERIKSELVTNALLWIVNALQDRVNTLKSELDNLEAALYALQIQLSENCGYPPPPPPVSPAPTETPVSDPPIRCNSLTLGPGVVCGLVCCPYTIGDERMYCHKPEDRCVPEGLA